MNSSWIILFRTLYKFFIYNKMFTQTVSTAYDHLGEPHQRLQNLEFTYKYT